MRNDSSAKSMQPEQGNDWNPCYPFLNLNVTIINNNTKLKRNNTKKPKHIDVIEGKDKTNSAPF